MPNSPSEAATAGLRSISSFLRVAAETEPDKLQQDLMTHMAWKITNAADDFEAGMRAARRWEDPCLPQT